MKVYLVGGAVRDQQLGLPVRERDWCVVSTTPDEMLSLGYKPVGKDFPVFLHPDTGEEYALARTERKTAAGYHGFTFHTTPDVQIEDDLARRDLTINALARDDNGNIIDPYGGMADLRNRKLRHVSEAFVEDPVRVLRVARFAARFNALGFTIAAETLTLMKEMVTNGEVDALVTDRVWKETDLALATDNPQVFFEVLRECGALEIVFPEVDALFGVPQPPEWHPEIDCGLHTMMVLQQAALLSAEPAIRFAALVHDLGKATTSPAYLPAHHGHEARSVGLVRKLASRLPVPVAYRDLALLVAEFHGHCHRAFELKPATILRLLQQADAFRRPRRFEDFLVACEADARGRTGFEQRDYPQVRYLHGAYTAAASVSPREFVDAGYAGEQIRAALDKARLAAIRDYKTAQAPKK